MVPLIGLAVLAPAVSSALPPPSTSTQAIYPAEEGGLWVISQSEYRDSIQDQAIRYGTPWTEQEKADISGLESFAEVRDISQSDLGSRALLLDSRMVLMNSEWEEVRTLELSGDPEFLVSQGQYFNLVDKVYEGGRTSYYLQKVSYNLEEFSSKKKLDIDIDMKGLDRFNGSWVAVSQAPQGAQISYYDENWTLQREKEIELPGRSENSEIKGFEATINDFWILTSEEGGFGGKAHRLTTEPEYTGTYYDAGRNSTAAGTPVPTTIQWTLPQAVIAAAGLLWVSLGLLIMAFLLLIGPYRTWKKHIKEEAEQEASGEDEEEASDEEASDEEEQEENEDE